MYSIAWLVIFIILLIFEIMTLGLTTIWFAAGALVAFIASLLQANIIVQVILFLLVSALALIFMRPVLASTMNKHTQKTNIDGLIGKSARVTAQIDNIMGRGSAIINGLDWTARSLNDEIIPEGTIVTVVEVRGVKLIVKKKEEDVK